MEEGRLDHQVSREDLAEVIRAYQIIGDFLERMVDRRDLYQTSFIDDLDPAMDEVRQGKTLSVSSFKDFVS